MQVQQSYAERIIVGTSVICMPLLFIGQIVLGIYLIINMNDPQMYLIAGTVLAWLQYSQCIIFFKDHYKNFLNQVFKSWNSLPQEERGPKQEKMLYGLSMNPFYPIFNRFFKFAIPIIVGCYILYIIVYSFYWKKNMEYFEALNNTDHILMIIFFTLSWCLLAFPLTSLIIGATFILTIGLPLVIYDLIRGQKDRPASNINIRKIVQTFVGAQRYRADKDVIEKVDSCTICLNIFKELEIIVNLKCHQAHVFHEKCLNQWTENRLQCPMCREQLHVINIVDNLDEKPKQNQVSHREEIVQQNQVQVSYHDIPQIEANVVEQIEDIVTNRLQPNNLVPGMNLISDNNAVNYPPASLVIQPHQINSDVSINRQQVQNLEESQFPELKDTD
ncbi:zinc finger protein [Stylonychia lemnae]|uniref:Zinc finger protein n=1 Tax=Stylonychia lemnae TaxID=5949 RepID=A0A078ACU1_STYLE|nr:zinc finger protein [Stylonychia lemnae]|eukprot:CDW80075.1 zinc finger protein [Stylonychia lemnae]